MSAKSERNWHLGFAAGNAAMGGVVGANTLKGLKTNSRLGTAVGTTWAGLSGALALKEASQARQIHLRAKKNAFGVSSVSKAVKLPDGSWVRLRALKVRSSIPPHAQVENHVGATRKGKRVGTLVQFRDDGMVGGIGVEEGLRRKGVATAMWRRAEKAGWQPKHSPARTPEGDAWARTVGGHLPKNTY